MRGRVLWCAAAFGLATSAAGDEPVALPGLSAPVEAAFDAHRIPHIYAASWADAYRALGAIHVQERLLQMEFNRRLGSGTLAELLGPDAVESDMQVRRLRIRSSCQKVWDSPETPDAMKAEFAAYAEGVNAALAAVDPETWKVLGFKPVPWHPVDSLVFSKYMGWDQGGTSDDLWLARMVEKFGAAALEELWPLERPYEIPIVRRQFDREVWGEREGGASASLERARGSVGAARGLEGLLTRAQRAVDAARWRPRSASFGSNNWAVAGSKTASGKPILCNDPHLGFHLPSIWHLAHLCVEGKSVVGATFPGSPIVIIGHNDRLGWGVTNMQADAVDYFIETLHPEDPKKYLHRGEWKTMRTISEAIPVRGEAPRIFEIEETVHGPIVSREEKAVSMSWTGLGPTSDSVGLWRINRAGDVREWLAALDLVDVPALNVVYADVEGNIAIHTTGRLPVRLRGEGRLPLDGASGEWDWAGWIDRRDLPLAVNPREGYVQSANGRPHPLGHPHYLGWMWDPSYRTRRIVEMLDGADGLTIASMSAIQTDALDFAARQFLPTMTAAARRRPPSDPFAQKVLETLSEWDCVAHPESTAPLFWLRWFNEYRKGVWEDEWEARGLPKEAGSWGFCGENRREPMLEVLEFLTKSHPESRWFDDRRTPERETRDDVVVQSFQRAVDSLRVERGDDPASYAWKHLNVLHLRSMTGDPSLARAGGPIAGTSYTVNPGGEGGRVGGGATLRLIVDFGDPTSSVGAYPGGQSADPESGAYDDLAPIWAAGRYVPLHMHGSLEALPPEAKGAVRRYVP
jgi:penicillin amidase